MITLHALPSTLYTPHTTLHALHSTHYTPHITLRTLLSTHYTPQITLHTLHSTLYTPHITLRKIHSTHYTPHITFHTSLSPPFSNMRSLPRSLEVFFTLFETFDFGKFARCVSRGSFHLNKKSSEEPFLLICLHDFGWGETYLPQTINCK